MAVRSQDIRERFLDFFASRGHQRLPSASLVPDDDPTVLFTVAGMVPLKPYILGRRSMPGDRATSAQKCFRVVDIEEVGDATHSTFFEMLGSWSFGSYFKEGAIDLAWRFLTQDLGLDPARLRPSVHPTDSVALAHWRDVIGIPAREISRLEDNWWQAGPTGPCGFDSEIYWDWGAACSCGRPDCRPDDECAGDRWMEVWNLVFMEFDQDAEGRRRPLPRPSVDTGMGLERLTAVLQGVRSSYETDLLAPLVAGFAARSSADRGRPEDLRALRVLSDHLRAGAFLIGDGVLPGKEGRGYVLRRVLRRAALFGRRIDLRQGLAGGVGDLVAIMGDVYPELVEHRGLIEATLRDEDAAFERTLSAGLERLQRLLAGGTSRLGGEDAFRLHDTYGFPVELTVELARERGVEVDLAGFDAAMRAQRQRGRAHADRTGFAAGPELPPSTFVGHDQLGADAVALWVGTAGLEQDLPAGTAGEVVVDPSPFYAESGGQVGDRGTLTWAGGHARVLDTQPGGGGETRVSRVEVQAGTLHAGEPVRAEVDRELRAQTARHHSATHLLHQALRNVLGETAVQRGSLVRPDYTTFDVTFSRALTPDEIERVQHQVNDAIRRNLTRTVTVMPIAAARASGAVALFGEKYGQEVRVVEFDGFSRELCGGTHVARSGDIGAAIITGEESIGTGLRRLEMVVGAAAERRWTGQQTALQRAAEALRSRPEEVPERIEALQAQLRAARKEAEAARRAALSGGGAGSGTVERVGGVAFGHLVLDGDGKAVQDAGDGLAGRLDGGVALVLGTSNALVKVGRAGRAVGHDARALLEVVTEVAGGRGGGNAERAMGGLADPTRRAEAVDAVRAALTRSQAA